MVENPSRIPVSTMDCKNPEQLMLYAAGALEPDEAARVADHLERGCPACERTLADAEAMLARLATPPEPVEPPGHLKQRVMAAAIGGGEFEQSSGAEAADASKLASGAGGERNRDPLVGGSGRPSWWRRLTAPAAAAALAAVMTYGGLELLKPSHQQELQTLRQKVQTLQEAEDQLARLSGVMDDWSELVSTLASSTARIVSLKEVSGDSDASGRFLLDPKRRTGCLLISGLQPPDHDGDGAYRVWLVTEDNEPREVGSLSVDSTGRGWLVADLGSDLSDVVKVNVGYRSDNPEADGNGRTLLAADFKQ